MKIALYVAKDQNSMEFCKILKESMIELSPEIEIVEIEDKHLDERNIESFLNIFKAEKFNFIITIGGTGTFLRAIFLNRNSIPIVAASSDKISFFTEINPNNMNEILPLVIGKKYFKDKYSRIQISGSNSKTPLAALNEIALFPKDSALLMSYTLVVDNNMLYRGRADGLIISTALGSTGYALSSGGPIAFGNPDILIVVPVNPLNKDHIPLVVPIDSEIKITNLKSRASIDEIIDGQIRIKVEDKVIIKKASSKTQIIRFHTKKNILAKLRNRLVELDLQNLRGVPPSAKYIFKLLLTEGEMTQKELIESTGLPNRTVRNALNILKEKGIISQRPHLRDARQSIYYVS
ncbi:MAG: NAD(+)/NADH kinase [Candidatus Heimdallarchaeaceae archaeon]